MKKNHGKQAVISFIGQHSGCKFQDIRCGTGENHLAAMSTLLGKRVLERMTMNGGRWVNFNWESWRPNVVQPGIAK